MNADPHNSYDDDFIDFGTLLATLWRGKIWIVLCVLLAGLAGVFVAVTATPIYRADSLLQLEEKSGQLGLPAALTDLTAEDPRSVTEIEIIRSRMVLSRAAAELQMAWKAEPVEAPVIGNALTRFDIPLLPEAWRVRFANRESAIRLDLLEVPPAWVGRAAIVTSGVGDTFSVVLPDGREAAGSVGTTLRDAEGQFAMRIGVLRGPVGAEYRVMMATQTSVIDELRANLSVAERGRQSGILALSYTAPDPMDAARILDAIAKSYLRQNVARSAAEARSGLDFIETQLPRAEAAVAAAEDALNALRQNQQSVDMALETQSLLTQVTQLENELGAFDARELEIADLYTQNHPIYRQLLAARGQIEDRLARLRGEIAELPQAQRDLVNLTRNLELAQTGYFELLNRAQELQVLQASSIGNVRIIDTARATATPISPRKQRIVALSVILGGLAGSAIVFLMSFLRKGIVDPEQLERAGIPVFATIGLSAQARVNPKGRGKLPIFVQQYPDDLISEAFRSLRTSLHFGMLGAQSKSVALISSAPAVGKSFVAVNLGTVMAQAGQRVCVVDADMRRGYLRRFFGVAKEAPGLSELLAGDVTLNDVLQEGPVPGLFVIPRGQVPPNPSELLMHKRLTALVQDLNARFDLAVFDTPPALAVTDAAIMGQVVGASIAVVRHDVTQIAELEAMIRDLDKSGVKVKGAVLNAYNPKVAGKQGAYAYSYRYAYTSTDTK